MNTRKVRCYDLEGNMLEDFETVNQASKKLNLTTVNISQCLLGDINSVKSFQFRRLTSATPNTIGCAPNRNTGKKQIPVVKYWGKKLICVYNSISDAAEKNDCTPSEISTAMQRDGTANGFTFKKI